MENFKFTNSYPGRGIVIGMTPDGKNMAQVYWIMGRSENSRNRIFVLENEFVKTQAYDIAKLSDPSLVIYYAAKHYDNVHIVTNGDQTDTIYEMKSFENALHTRTFEPDSPNYTPRISGVVDFDGKYIYKLSILKSIGNNPDYCIRQYFNYDNPIAGAGHCIHTYECDSNPLKSFNGEPYIVPVFDCIDETAEFYWNKLNEENRISLFVKFINIETKETNIKIINKNI